MAFLVTVNKNLIDVETRETITSGSSNVYVMKFNFSDEWAALERVAVFRKDSETPINVLLDETNQCMIPWEVMTTPDSVITFGVYGTMDGNVVLPTVWANGGLVVEGVITGIELEPPTPDIYQQILAKLAYIENNLGSSGGSGDGGNEFNYKIGHGLKVTGDELSVDTTNNFDGDNTLPMTAAGVQNTLGNIEALLATI